MTVNHSIAVIHFNNTMKSLESLQNWKQRRTMFQAFHLSSWHSVKWLLWYYSHCTNEEPGFGGALLTATPVNKRQSCAEPRASLQSQWFQPPGHTRLCQINCQKWLWSLTVIFCSVQANLDSREKEKFPKENPRSVPQWALRWGS